MAYQPNIQIFDANGSRAEVSRYGQVYVANKRDDILVRFEYNNSTEDVTATTSGTGTTANSGSTAQVKTGTGVGTAKLVSVDYAIYRPAHEVYAYFTSVYTTTEANTYQRHGIHDTVDGFFFGYEGTSFGITVRGNSVDTTTTQSSWNGDKCDGTGTSGFVLNPLKYNQYKITYGWLGSAPATFSVYGGKEHGWIICHTYDISNTVVTPVVKSPSLPITMEVGRTSGTGASLIIASGCWSAGSTEGIHVHAGHRVFGAEISATLSAGVETHIATFFNVSTFQSKINKILAEASFLGAATDGAKSAILRFKRNATVTGTAFSNVDANNSIMQYSTAGTYTGGTGKHEFSVPMAKVDTAIVDLGAGHIHLDLHPGETMTLTGFSSASNDVIISFRWEEYFA